MLHSPSQLALGAIALVAALVNGALGYGFSSITVPLALLLVTNRVLNPALVPVEVLLNAHVLWTNRAALPRVWRRVAPVAVGLLPGIALGTLILARVAAGPLKLATFGALLPLILMQAAGYRRPVRAERSAGALFGTGVGLLYASTTISGPPLALALNNQGFSKEEFRAALGFVRLVESSMTAAAYLAAGLFTASSVALIPLLLPGVALGVPIGARVIRHLPAETFRRVCMSFDAWVVAFGISLLLRELHLVENASAYLVLIAVGVIDGWLLYRFFSAARRAEVACAA
jgi:uncharacterized membrane protein YfcA